MFTWLSFGSALPSKVAQFSVGANKEKGIQSYWDALAKLQAMSQPRFRRPNKNGIPGTVTCEPGDSEDVSKAYILQQLAEAEEGADEGLA